MTGASDAPNITRREQVPMLVRDAVAPAVALVSYVLLHWSGIGLDPDSWAAWQGAISIVAGKGYTYFSGNAIHSWPPLYSLYLALWIAVIGPTAWTLLISNAVLVLVQTVLWVKFARTVVTESGGRLPAVPSLVISVFVGLFIALYEQSAFSHNLVYTILPIFLVSIWRFVSPNRQEIGLGNSAFAIALATGVLLTHTSSIAYIAAGSLLIVLNRRLARDSLVLAALLVGVPMLIWLVVRTVLDQGGSHHIGLGAGRFSFPSYVVQLLENPGSLLLPAKAGAAFVASLLMWGFALAMVRRPGTDGLRFGLSIAAVSSLVLFALFNLTWIFASLAGRFVLFIPLILVPLIYATAWPVLPRAATVLMALAMLPLLYWTTTWSIRQQTQDLVALGFPGDFVPPNAYISRDYRTGPPVESKRGLLIAPSADEEIRGRRT